MSALLDIVRRHRAEHDGRAVAVADHYAPLEPKELSKILYPDTGPLRRELYPRHLQFFAAGGYHDPIETWCPDECDGSPHRERLALCANRVGKTLGMGGYETALHLTGRYPDWWIGHRFDHPIEAWVAGKTNETTRDIIQREALFGRVRWNGRKKTVEGTGLIPKEDIGEITWKRGIPDFIDTVQVKHQSGGRSLVGIKSYEQGRGSFEGTAKDLVWFDEEPPLEIYTEGSIRLMTKRGMSMLTFTPLEGMSQVVMAFPPGGRLPGEAEF
jgi:phage terminase large subunit-like protein